MTDRPILFSAPMVRAILAGEKTQTRRVIKPQPSAPFGFEKIVSVLDPFHENAFVGTPAEGLVRTPGPRERKWCMEDWCGNLVAGWDRACPYGVPGDRLWVRETWRICDGYDDLSPTDIALDVEIGGVRAPIEYVADGARVHWPEEAGRAGKTRVSIHMPRWASRITLEVTGVRVERLQDITDKDAEQEGCVVGAHAFERLWKSIDGDESWDANPWVWVVEFRELKP